ncbi:MAG: response regulator transcription factor [Desulfuromonadaceae bacterium]|nr:response regulator transcription factor [Desulfuromonadaceae bacterium]MDD5106898.1 response regulator transcription factor [Desulfuromonadaceae bacterium]
MNRILVVDDHVIVRQGLIQLLSIMLEPAMMFDEASTGQEGIDKFNENDYCLALVDISLPGRNGLDVLRLMRKLKPKVPILVLSMHPDEQYAVRALRAGASGYVAKASASEELKGAISKALRGEKYVTPFQATLLADAVSEDHDVAGLHNLLSDREYQFACMLTSGKTPTQIAQELNLSVKTISSYRTRVLEKLHLKNNAEIINYCITNGIVQ